MAAESELVRIRLLDPALAQQTGAFGRHTFVDGVSAPMTRRDAEKLSVITKVEFLEDAETMWERKSRERGLIRSSVEPESSKPDLEAAQEVSEPSVKRYSRDELGAIADTKGIQGLREIADPLDVRGVSIRALIDGIMAAQG